MAVKGRFVSVTAISEMSHQCGIVTGVPPAPPSPVQASQLFVAGSSCEIMLWPLTATGNVAPTINIQGSATTLTSPLGNDFSFTYGLDIDASGNQYAFNFWAEDGGVKTYFIPIFAKGATGNVAPIRSITRPEIVSYIGSVELPSAGICLDGSGNIYVGVKTTIFKISNDGSTISTFVNNDTDLTNITSLRFDPVRNWIWASSFAPAVKSYNLSGTVQRSLTWPTLFSPWQVTTDSVGQIYVADSKSSTGFIYIFPEGANGTTPPTRTIENDSVSTSGAFVMGVGVDQNGIIYACYNSNVDSAGHVVSYAANASGVATPLTDISGSATFLDHMLDDSATQPQQLNVR